MVTLFFEKFKKVFNNTGFEVNVDNSRLTIMRNWDNSWEDITIEFNEESATIEGYYNALSYSYLEVYWNESDSADNIFDAIKGGVIVVYGEMYRERMDEMFNK